MSLFYRILYLFFMSLLIVGSVKNHLTDGNWEILNEGEGWSFCGGCGSFEFNQNGTFIFRKIFNNDGVNEYVGKWRVSNTGEYFADITLDFSTTGEYTNEIGKSVIGTVGESLVLHINYPDGDIEYWNTVNR